MRFGNRTFDPRHLSPLRLEVQWSGNAYAAFVRFSCHFFTVKSDASRHNDQAFCECPECRRQEKRTFDADRCQLSSQLPGLFRDLGNKTVYHTKRNSLFFVRNVPVMGKSGSNDPYAVYFKVFPATDADVIVQVVSACQKSRMMQRASPVTFSRLICSKARNEPLQIGPPCKVKRR